MSAWRIYKKMFSLQELHQRLSLYIHNVEKNKSIITNHDYTLITTDSRKINLKVGTIFTPSDFYRHIAIFFETIGETELQLIPELLKEYIDQDEFKYINIFGVINYEDNRKIENDNILFTGKIYLETNSLKISKARSREILNKLNLKYKGRKISFSIRDNKDWSNMDKSNWPSCFLCHDSNDKNKIEEIYGKLIKQHINVWFDKYSLKVGDSLTKMISQGLDQSDYGLIFISKNFLSNKKWVEFEIQALINKQIYTGKKTILPIWLDIEEDDLEKHHWLRDKLAIKYSNNTEVVVKKIVEVVKN